MKIKLKPAWLTTCCLMLSLTALAQDEDFNFGDFAAADDTEIKNYCNNKVLNLSPSKLISLSFDQLWGYDFDTEQGDAFVGPDFSRQSKLKSNVSWRLETNYPIISKSSLLVNAYLNYWESQYNFANRAFEDDLSATLGNTALRTTNAGLIVFKPLNEKRFLIIQGEAAMNGNYDFGDISPETSKMKYSGALLYGWKFNDNTNFAVGVTRTYRGGRVLHIPIVMYNKTWNEKWGLEMLLPARGAVRRNFSTKSILMFGYELEGQSYHLQSRTNQPLGFGSTTENRD